MSKKLSRLTKERRTAEVCRLPLCLMFFSSFYFSSVLANAENAAPSPVIQQAQQGTIISGTVTDGKGEPIIGASVRVPGSKQGTITDFDGKFKIKVAAGTKLSVSYIGFNAKTVEAKDGMTVTLEDNATMLSDVQVVAYGVQKKVTVTGAISGMKGDELMKTPVASVTNMLSGQISGVSSIQASGEPGSDAATLFVRGRGTFDSSSPLIQVDGVTRDASIFNTMDPNEIESISVLKDASATAVFGVEGANGVILITTKRGKEGKARISFSSTESIVMPTKPIETVNSYQYATFHNQMRKNDGLEPQFSDYVLQKFKDHSSPIFYPDLDWMDLILKKTTFQSQNNVNISGGTKNVRYFVSAGMMTQGGMFKQFSLPYDMTYQYKRYNYRANLDLDLTKTTTLSASIAGKVDNSNKPYTGQGASGVFKQLYYSSPFSSPGFVDGKLVYTSTNQSDYPEGEMLPFTGTSPIGAYFGKGFMSTSRNTLSIDVNLKQKLDFVTKGLAFHIKGAYNSDFTVSKSASASIATYQPVYRDGVIKYRKSGENTDLTYDAEGNSKGRNWYMEAGFNYDRDFGNHHVGGLVLYNQRRVYYPSQYSDIPRGLVGLVGRVTYDWKSRYMAEFNVGYNGSENFPENKRFGFFPAGSAGWVVSEESFWKPLKKVVSFLKLRASWGLVGKDNVGDRFLYTPDPYSINESGQPNRGGWGYIFGLTGSTTSLGARETARHNPDVGWEKAFKQDYGVDVRFLGDRLSATFDYYKEHRTDILLRDATAPVFLGFSVPYANLGVMNSWGWEVSLKWDDKIGKDFRYWVAANLSYNQNEVVDRKEEPQQYAYQMQKGHRYGARSLYKFYKFYYDGIEKDYEKEFGQPFPTQFLPTKANAAEGQEYLKPGDAVYVDLNGDGKIDNLDTSRELGTYTDDPEYILGLNMGFSWKHWELTMQWTGAFNVTRQISGTFNTPFKLNSGGNTEGGLLKYLYDYSWSEENPSQDALYPRPSWSHASQNLVASTLYNHNAAYVRLKSLQIAYNFNFPFMRKIKLNQLQLAFSGYNLFTITSYKFGDPEGQAVEAPNYPLTRNFAVSLKLAF